MDYPVGQDFRLFSRNGPKTFRLRLEFRLSRPRAHARAGRGGVSARIGWAASGIPEWHDMARSCTARFACGTATTAGEPTSSRRMLAVRRTAHLNLST